ncbi:MAG: hypothetical protein HRT65_06555 [Flavobacteriaceae bacterium]|nr:hypothetical protein [Flavobacteriaceae bacterium]
MKRKAIFFQAVFVLLLIGCTNDSESDLLLVEEGENEETVDPDDGTNATVTYGDDIAPIITRNCLGCHSNPTRNGAPFSLTTFAQVSSRSDAILRTTSLQTGEPGAMPPAARIPQASIDLIAQWIEEGTPE